MLFIARWNDSIQQLIHKLSQVDITPYVTPFLTVSSCCTEQQFLELYCLIWLL